MASPRAPALRQGDERAEAGEASLRSLRLRQAPGTWFIEAVASVPEETPLSQFAQWQRAIAARLTAPPGPVEFLLNPEPVALFSAPEPV